MQQELPANQILDVFWSIIGQLVTHMWSWPWPVKLAFSLLIVVTVLMKPEGRRAVRLRRS